MDTSKARSNSIITTSVNDAMTEIKFNVKDTGSVTVRLAKLTDMVRTQATLHGIKQKICDAAAMSRDPVTFKPASAVDKLAAMREIAERLENGGQWNGSGGGGAGDTVMLVNCLRELYPQTDDNVIVAKVTALTAMQRKAYLLDSKIAPIAARLSAERVKGVDTAGLFSELDSIA